MTKLMHKLFDMTLKPIRTNQEYDLALKRLNEIFDAEENTPQANEAEILVLLIENYEEKKFPIPELDPIDAIKERMSQLDLKQKDLIGIIGTKSQVSEILNRKKRMTVEMIRNVESNLKLPASLLIQNYHLTGKRQVVRPESQGNKKRKSIKPLVKNQRKSQSSTTHKKSK